MKKLIFIALFCARLWAQNPEQAKPVVYGRADTHALVSLWSDKDGHLDVSSLKPSNAGQDWQPPQLVPLVKLPKPSDGQVYEPTLVWSTDKVERRWVVHEPTPAEVAAARERRCPAINRRQFRLQLLSMGVLPQVEALVAAGSQELKIWWEDTTEYHITHPLVAGFAQQLGLTTEQVNAIWQLAHAL